MTKPDKIQLHLISGRQSPGEITADNPQRIILMDPATATLFGGMTKIQLQIDFDPRSGNPSAVLKVANQHSTYGFQVEPLAVNVLLAGVDLVRWNGLGLMSRQLEPPAPQMPPESSQVVEVPAGPVDMTNPADQEMEVSGPVDMVDPVTADPPAESLPA